MKLRGYSDKYALSGFLVVGDAASCADIYAVFLYCDCSHSDKTHPFHDLSTYNINAFDCK